MLETVTEMLLPHLVNCFLSFVLFSSGGYNVTLVLRTNW